MNEAPFLIRNASAITTGLNEDGGRHAGPDIRIAGGVIVEIGSLVRSPVRPLSTRPIASLYPSWS